MAAAKRAPFWLSGVALALAAAAGLGWTLGMPILASLLPDLAMMKANTALGVALAALGLMALSPTSSVRQALATGCGALCAIIGLATLAQSLSGVSFGIDTLLAADPWTSPDRFQGRMSAATAAALLAVGVCIALLSVATTRRWVVAAHALAAVPGAVGFLALAGYLYNNDGLYTVAPFMTVALNTALALTCLSAAVVATRAEEGLLARYRGHPLASRALLRFIALAIAIPLAVGFVAAQGVARGWHDVSFAPVIFALGTAIAFIWMAFKAGKVLRRAEGAMRDASRETRRQAEELSLIFDASPVGLAMFDTDLRFLKVNERLATINGYSVDEHIGRTVHELLAPDVAAAIEAICDKVKKGEAVEDVAIEGHHPNADGRGAWLVSYRPLRGGGGSVERMLCTVVDVTARIEAERAIAEREALLQAIGASSPDLIYAKDTQGRILYANPATLRVVGQPREQLIGKTALEHSDDPSEGAAVFANDMHVISTGEVATFDEAYTSPDGTRRIWQSTKGPLRDAGGAVIGLVGTTTDVTARRAAEARRAFLLDLADRLRMDPRATLVTARALGEHFGVSRAGVTEANETGDVLAVVHEYVDGDIEPAIGEHRLHEFGDWLLRDLQAGKTVAIDDVTSDPRTAGQAERFLSIGARSVLSVPVLQGGRLAATVYLDHKETRRWRTEDVDLLQEVAARTFASVERERTEERLRQSEARIRAFMDTTPALVWQNDAEGRNLFVNDYFLRFTGMSAQQLRDSGWQNFVHQDDREAYVSDYLAAVGGRRAWSNRCRARRHDGAWRWLESSAQPLFDAAGRFIGHAGVTFDVTAQMETEQALRSSEARIKAVLDAAPIGLVFAEAPSGRVTGGNQTIEQIFGHALLPAEDVEQYHHYVGFHPDGRRVESHEYPLAKVMAGAQRAELEVRYQRGDGRMSWICFIASPIKDESGRTTGGVVAALDIDPQRRAEDGLRELNATLGQQVEAAVAEREAALRQLHEAQKMETIGQLTGGVAHDFNNLLFAILSNLDLVRKRTQDARAIKLLDGAVKGAERGAALTKRLLAFARRQELKAETVDVAQLFEGMQDLLARSLGPGVEIAADLPATLPAVSIDANQLELAILNLAVNARDAMPLGGRLTIDASPIDVSPNEDMRGLMPGAYLRLRVGDTGQGMDPDTLRRATEPFFTTKGVGKGTGLGLSMVQGLAVQSGGAISIESAPGKGTTISLFLPQASASEQAPPVAAVSLGEAAASQMGLTILVVDDDALVGMGTAAMLEDLGHVVLEASSGRAALETLKDNPEIDLIITDHAMPGMTGADLAKAVRAERPALPIILATGYAELPNGEDPGLPRLAKPFRQEDLIAAIAELRLDGSDRKIVSFRKP
jgi:PAS domain S-box-containing protein